VKAEIARHASEN